MRILIRTSRWAIWARRLGSFALPLLVLPVLMHRAHVLPSNAFVNVLALATLVALAAVLSAFIAFLRLWRSGDRGWGRAALGGFLGLLVLSPMIYGALLVAQYPAVADVTTGPPGEPPLILSDASGQPALAAPRTHEEFPKAATRTYAVDGPTVLSLIEAEVQSREWDIRQRREPVGGQPGGIIAIATTWLGWRDEVVIQVQETAEGTNVDMRSASFFSGGHDLGANGRRIEDFLTALDDAVTAWQKANPSSAADTPSDSQ